MYWLGKAVPLAAVSGSSGSVSFGITKQIIFWPNYVTTYQAPVSLFRRRINHPTGSIGAAVSRTS
jgi:hypothetical protein